MKYRPFTLEGNFAFAAGIQEMLIQSHTGIIHIFPAIPESWKDAGFNTLRTEGAFLVSAQRKGGTIEKVEIVSEKGGICKMKDPFGTKSYHLKFSWKGTLKTEGEILVIEFPKSGKLVLSGQ